MVQGSLQANGKVESRAVRTDRKTKALPKDAAMCQRAPTSVHVNLSSLDLNLLVALEALLDKRNVTHAASRVGLSQPAMSRSLARLRHMFNDDLLVRTSSGLVHTARSEELFKRLPEVLSTVRELICSRTLPSDEWRWTVRVAMADHQTAVILMPLMSRLNARSRHVDLISGPLARGTLKRLEEDEIDLAIGQLSDTPSGFYRRTLYVDRYRCLVRNNHPAVATGLTEETFYRLRHAVVAPGSEEDLGEVYDALDRILPGRERVVTPSIMAAPMMVAESDLVLTVPSRMADKMAAMLPLVALDLPIRVPPLEVTLLWHERHHRNTEHAWLRAEVAAAAAAIT